MHKIDKKVLQEEMLWIKTSDPFFPFERVDKDWRVRINDFPEEALFTLFVEEHEAFDFDDWPEYWDRPES